MTHKKNQTVTWDKKCTGCAVVSPTHQKGGHEICLELREIADLFSLDAPLDLRLNQVEEH